ncbi:MAG TPA: phenylalanine--tRNA ligase subunit beta [Ignavibacteria bacterium]|nr:phenylalanine--tRNA ligase subunit beta [Ignavibacteria bacterium]
MKISLNWLKDYIPDLPAVPINTLSEKMISIGLDIEGIEDESIIYDKFVVGEVIEKDKHPDAEKLSLCKVNTGNQILSIVCGAPNVAKGQKVCVALTGAIIPNGNFEIKKSKIRGVLSEGMICSEKELNMSENHDGILILDPDAVPGDKFSDHIKANDFVFDIGITANRGDLYSYFGVAREVAAMYDKKITKPDAVVKESATATKDMIKITIDDPSLCRRFTGRVIRNVEIKESPDWLKKKLNAIGLKPKNNIVDITNFVMFETGQPLHAFDYDKIRGKEIIVKIAKEGDKFTTLDSKERTLNAGSLMICDAEGYTGIAGVMGGKDSEISESTKNIFLEVAYFDPVCIRKNSKKLGLQTDASQRFERGIDMDLVDYSSKRATQLIQELAGGEVSRELYDVYPEKFEVITAGMRLEKANDLIGIILSEDEVINLLYKIDIKFLKKEDDRLIFVIPEFRRTDISREADLIEEVTRIYGYDNIEGDMNFSINVSNSRNYAGKNFKYMKDITEYLSGRGFNQILTNPLVEEKKQKIFRGDIVKLLNSISVEMDSLRTNMSYGMLKVISNNFNNSGRNISLKLFETGRVFSGAGNRFSEEDHLIMAISGKKDAEMIYGGDNDFDIFDIKGEVEMFLSKLNLENITLFYYNDKVLNEVTIDIKSGEEKIGSIFKADKKLKKEFEIESDVYIAELYLNKIYVKLDHLRKYREISKFPSVKRDLALVVDKKVTFDELKNSILRSAGKMLKNLHLFDLYEDPKLGEGKKSLAFSIEFSSAEKTLTDEETNKFIKKIIKNLESDLGAALRA